MLRECGRASTRRIASSTCYCAIFFIRDYFLRRPNPKFDKNFLTSPSVTGTRIVSRSVPYKSSSTGLCLEKRAFYRVISGLHTSITVAIAVNNYVPREYSISQISSISFRFCSARRLRRWYVATQRRHVQGALLIRDHMGRGPGTIEQSLLCLLTRAACTAQAGAVFAHAGILYRCTLYFSTVKILYKVTRKRTLRRIY